MSVSTAAREPEPVWLDFRAIDARCQALGAETEEARAELLGVARLTLYRLRRGLADITLGRVVDMAAALDVTPRELLLSAKPPPKTPPPSRPAERPRPPSGPQVPPAPRGPARGDAS